MADDKKKPKEDPKAEAARRRKKTVSVRKLAEQIHSLRRKVTRDLKSDDERTQLTALAIALIDKTAERVGNEGSAKDGHFGVTGWQSQHVTIEGSKVRIKYVGKSGVDQEKEFTDETIAKLLKKCKDKCDSDSTPILSCGDGGKVHADSVNRYLSEFEVTAKDIRGFAANTMVVEALKRAEKSSDKEERKKKFQEVINTVADKVGHQRATLKKHYLLPGIEEEYVTKGKMPSVKNASIRDHWLEASVAARIAADSLLEDVFPVTSFEIQVRTAVEHWQRQHDYEGVSWDGIEAFCLSLAIAADAAAVEVSGWYAYPSSVRRDMDGNDWRYVLPDPSGGPTVVVNCHTLLHDFVWTLATTVYSTGEVDELAVSRMTIYNADPWFRSILWARETARALAVGDSGYAGTIADMERRTQICTDAWQIFEQVKPAVEAAHQAMFGNPGDIPDTLTIAVNAWGLPKGKVGSFRFPGDEYPWGLMTVNPSAADKPGLLRNVVVHETIHAALGEDDAAAGPHNDTFREMADMLGVPPEYQD